MGTKNITIMEDVYQKLVGLKGENESFSDELRRLLKSKESIMTLAGSWKDVSDKEIKDIKANIVNMRKGAKLSEIGSRVMQ